ncbi:MAG: LemA family protein [Deltaproteobacteria bacterium]|nr:LemA family protein [Deltaproteobacteria bacterium]
MKSRVKHIINKLSPGRSNQEDLESGPEDDFEDLGKWAGARKGIHGVVWRLGYVLRRRWMILSACLMLLVSVYYYNHLYKLEWNARRDGSSVVVYMQMRRDLSVNISNLASAYIQHEKEIFKYVAEIKTAMVGREKMPSEIKMDPAAVEEIKKANPILGQFFALAEQYPDLKFSSEFHYAVTAVMDSEKELAAARVRYNESTNYYLTALQTFPGNFFGFIFRYKPLPYFEPDKGGANFVPMFENKEAPQNTDPKRAP